MNQQEIAGLVAGLAPVIKEYVASEFAALERRLMALESITPKDGINGEKGERGEQGEKGEQGIQGPPGEKGETGPAGEKGDRGDPGSPGEKGEQGEKGLEGPPGIPGRDGRDGQPGLPGEKGIDGKNGRDGADGKDGLGFDDLSVEHDGERTITLRFVRGETVKEFPIKLAIPLDRGVWKDGKYDKGDCVTWGGSTWIAQKDTDTKPDTAESDWRLSVKRGRDGKDGKHGEKGAQGPEGRPGRDLTHMMTDGVKY